MLARLQQITTLSLLATALFAAWWFGHQGAWGWAVGVPLLVLFGYAAFLAAEFVLVARVHGDDPAPRATVPQLLRAFAGEVVTAPRVFCWRQPFRARAVPDHLPADGAGRRGVLLVHGFVCNRGLWNPWLVKLRERGTPVIAVDLEPVFGSIDAYIGRIDTAVRTLEQLTGRPPIVVGHSMGGLAVRLWFAQAGHAERAERIVTIGTPHAGTWLARMALSANGTQMRQNGPWLAALMARETPAHYARFTCFYSHCDNIVFPASTATLPGADNRHLEGVAHVHMAFRPEVFAEVERLLDAP
jgi:triacylglycerol lipase